MSRADAPGDSRADPADPGETVLVSPARKSGREVYHLADDAGDPCCRTAADPDVSLRAVERRLLVDVRACQHCLSWAGVVTPAEDTGPSLAHRLDQADPGDVGDPIAEVRGDE